MQITLVVDIGAAGSERVVADELDLADLAFARRRHHRPVSHHRLTGGLAIDRPGRTMVVRLALFRSVVDMAENAEPELGILIEDFAFRVVVAQVLADEAFVDAGLLDEFADLFAAFRTRIGDQGVMTIGCELFERIPHRLTSFVLRMRASMPYRFLPTCTRAPAVRSIDDSARL